jgi:hypothetical protein
MPGRLWGHIGGTRSGFQHPAIPARTRRLCWSDTFERVDALLRQGFCSECGHRYEQAAIPDRPSRTGDHDGLTEPFDRH